MIMAYCLCHHDDGYRRLMYRMRTSWRKSEQRGPGVEERRPSGAVEPEPFQEGHGIPPTTRAHEHRHMDISHSNICGTFYYLTCAAPWTASAAHAHFEIRESMTEADVEIILQRAGGISQCAPADRLRQWPAIHRQRFPGVHPLEQNEARVDVAVLSQSNGTQERRYAALKECIHPGPPMSLEVTRRSVAEFVAHSNDCRLHSAIGYIAPEDKLESRGEAILAEWKIKLAQARRA